MNHSVNQPISEPVNLSFSYAVTVSVRYCRPLVSQSVIQSVNLSFLDSLCANLCWLILLGIVRWGTQIQRIIDDGDLLLQQTRTQDITSPITVLLEGEYPKYGEKNKQKRKRVPKSYAKRLVGETTAFSSYVWKLSLWQVLLDVARRPSLCTWL